MSLITSKTSLKSLKYSDFSQSRKVESPANSKVFKNTGASIGQHRAPDTKTGLGLQLEKRKEDVVRLTKATVDNPQAIRFQTNQILLNQSVAIGQVLRGKKPNIKQAALGLARVAGVTASAIAQAAGSGTGLRVIQGFVPLNGGYVVSKGRFGLLGAAVASLNPFGAGDNQISKANLALRGKTINDAFIESSEFDRFLTDVDRIEVTTLRTSQPLSSGAFSKKSYLANSVNLGPRSDKIGKFISGVADDLQFRTEFYGISKTTRLEATTFVSLFPFSTSGTIEGIEKDVKSKVYLGTNKEAKLGTKQGSVGKFFTGPILDQEFKTKFSGVSNTNKVEAGTFTNIFPFDSTKTVVEVEKDIKSKVYLGTNKEAKLATKEGSVGKFFTGPIFDQEFETKFSGVLNTSKVEAGTFTNIFPFDSSKTVEEVSTSIKKYVSTEKIPAHKEGGQGRFLTGRFSDDSVNTEFTLKSKFSDDQKKANKAQALSEIENLDKLETYINKKPDKAEAANKGPGKFITQTTAVAKINSKKKDTFNAGAGTRSLDDRFYVSGNTSGQDKINILKLATEEIKGEDSDIIPFTIQNIPATGEPTFLYFRAYLDTMTDTFGGEWSNTRYIGRAEELHNYTGFKREFQFSFKVAAHSPQELKPLYLKLNNLAGTTAPTYQNGLFMQGVFSKLTIGDYIHKLPGFFTSVDFTWQVKYPWEIGNVDTGAALADIPRVPHILDVSVNFKPIHDFAPQYNKTFFGVEDAIA